MHDRDKLPRSTSPRGVEVGSSQSLRQFHLNHRLFTPSTFASSAYVSWWHHVSGPKHSVPLIPRRSSRVSSLVRQYQSAHCHVSMVHHHRQLPDMRGAHAHRSTTWPLMQTSRSLAEACTDRPAVAAYAKHAKRLFVTHRLWYRRFPTATSQRPKVLQISNT